MAANPEPRNWRANIISLLGEVYWCIQDHISNLSSTEWHHVKQHLKSNELRNKESLVYTKSQISYTDNTLYWIIFSDTGCPGAGGGQRGLDDPGRPGAEGEGREDQAGRRSQREIQT